MRIPPILLATSLVATLAAQGVNCTLLGTFNDHGTFNDVWGYTAPNGDEYALLATRTGTVVIDVSNPASPVERGWFPWGTSIWRDIRTYGSYAYVVTEATAGFQILDLSNPNNPTEIGVFGTGNSNRAHNVCIDTGAGRLYLAGTNVGTPVYDLTGNPANPSFLGYATGSGNSNYFHDLCVENGYAYGAMIYNGVLRIVDASSSFPWGSLSNTPTPSNFTHNAWPNAAGTICATTDEQTGGVVKFFDITDKSNPIPLGQYTTDPSTVPHNAYIIGDKCHVSWYSEGYICIDISDPNNPIDVASYDTSPGGGGGSCWGCYPFLPSGNVLLSDGLSGLFIVKPTLASFTNYGQGCPGSVTQPCASINPNGGSLGLDLSENEYCYQVINAGSVQVLSFDIWTSSTGGTVNVPAHIYANAGGVPAATPVASTTLTVGPSEAFYTATFAAPVNVTGTFYLGMDSSAETVYVNRLTSGTVGLAFWRDLANGFPNWTQSGLFGTPSWKVTCAGGPQFVAPELGNNGLPILNTTYSVTLADAAPSTFALMLIGLSDTIYQGILLPVPLPGAPGCSVYAAPEVTELVITSGSGTASSSLSVPNSASLTGVSVYHQWAVLDAVNAAGIVFSNAGRATIDS